MITPIRNIQIKDCNSWYESDTGMDIAVPKGTGIRAVAEGELLYSEFGHTPWNVYPDTPGSILLKLCQPQDINGITYTYVWYTHLSKLVYTIHDEIDKPIRVIMGEYIGNTGSGNNNEHLHFGILTNRAQNDGDFMLPKDVAAYMRRLIRMGRNR